MQKGIHNSYISLGNKMLIQLAFYSSVQGGKFSLETAEISLSAARFTFYMLLMSWFDCKDARNSCQIAKHQARKGPTQLLYSWPSRLYSPWWCTEDTSKREHWLASWTRPRCHNFKLPTDWFLSKLHYKPIASLGSILIEKQ